MCMRYLFLIFCFGLGLTLTAQDTLFYENFQTGTLNGFISVDVDNLPLSDDFATLEGGFQVVPVAGANDFRALGVSAFLNGGTANNWLISPEITLGAAVTLAWDASSLSGDPAQAESYEVLLSQTGTELDDFTFVLASVTAETNTTREVDLSPFLGSTIHIAFRQNGQDNFALTIDNILLTQPISDLDAELSLVGDTYQDIDNPNLNIEIFNPGVQTLKSVLIELSVDGAATEFLVDGLDILSQTSGFAVINPALEGKFTFGIRLLEVNSVPKIDAPLVSRVIYAHSGGPATTQLMEVATSATCGFCPSAIVDRQLAEIAHSGELITLSVHSDDPLELPAYASGLENLTTFSGLPSAAYNRFTGGLTEDFGEEVAAGSGAAPVSLSVSHIYDPVTREMSVDLSGTSFTRFDDDDVRFTFIVVEDSIMGNSSQFDQANNFSADNLNVPLLGPDGFDYQAATDPILAEDIVYNRVVRDLVGGFDGIISSIPATGVGETFSHSFDYVLPSVFDENQVSLVVLVLDPTESLVLQAAEQALDFVSSVADNEVKLFSVYPNPANSSFTIEGRDTRLESYRLVDANGREVMSRSDLQLSGNQSLRVDCGHLTSGIYTISVSDGLFWENRRIVLLTK